MVRLSTKRLVSLSGWQAEVGAKCNLLLFTCLHGSPRQVGMCLFGDALFETSWLRL